MRRTIRFLRNAATVAAFVIFGTLIAARLENGNTQHHSGPFRVSDGDTLVAGGERLRLRGIDAPEISQVCTREQQEWPCGAEARKALSALVAGGDAACAGQERDRYGRLLVTCESGGRDINAEMVRSGMAVAYGGYALEEAEARAAGAGIWAGAFDRPQQWRRMHGSMDDAGGFDALLAAVRRMLGLDSGDDRDDDREE